MNREVIIKTEKIVKSYDITKTNRLEVLKGIDLEIYKGEIAAIVGKSGAGKSTLLHIIGTLDKPDKGKVYFDSTDVFEMSDKQLSSFRNKSVGFIFQFHHLLPEFTVIENILIPSLISGHRNREAADRIISEVGLSDRINHKPSEISGGEAQRVAIARALINTPKIVLADEPTGNLDTENAESVIDLIFKLRERLGQTFVIVTHNEEFAQRCDRIIKIADGIIINS